MKANIQIQTNSFIANVKDMEEIVKIHLKASDISLNTIDTLEIYYKPVDGSLFYVAITNDDVVYKNEYPLFV